MIKQMWPLILGLANTIHGMTHLIQFVQAVMLAKYATEQSQGIPWGAIFWALLGFITLGIGIHDYYHHRKCATEVNEK